MGIRVDRARHPAVDDIRELLTFRLAMLAAAGDRLGHGWLRREFGLRLQEWRVLGVVTAMAPVRFGTVSQALLLDKGQLSRLVKALASRDLLEARADAQDARTHRLLPTPAGRRLHDAVLPRALERNQRVLAALTPAEAATLFGLLDRLEPFMANRAGGGPGETAEDDGTTEDGPQGPASRGERR